MPNWKKLITSGSDASLSSLSLSGALGQNSEKTSLMINGNGLIGTRELGSLAFSSATYNNYTLPLGSSSTRGGFKIGYSESGKNYPIELSSEKMYVNVPWTDTNTQLTDAEIAALGYIKTASDTNTQNTAAEIRTKIGSGNNGHVPTTGTAGHFLKHDGTFGLPSYTTNTDTQLSTSEVREAFSAGDNVTIEEGVISSTDTNTQLSTADVRGKFSAGTNVTITDGVIASSFTDTNDDVSVANLKTRLAGGFGSNAVQIGDGTDIVTIGNKLVVAGDLVVNGATTTVNTANLNIEDSFILLASGSTERVDAGVIFNSDAAGAGDSFFYDSQSGRPSWASAVAFDATAVTPSAYIPRVYDMDAGMDAVAERGSIRVEGEEIFMYS